MPASTLKRRLELALADMANPPSQAELARLAGVKPPSVSDWFSGQTKSLRGTSLIAVAAALGVNAKWLNTGLGPMRPGGNATHPAFRVEEASKHYDSFHEIELVDARGSCGGGSVVWDIENREPLIKEPSWFQKYNVRPGDVFAVYADGDSMADFIVDGDIVIFDRTKLEPRSGVIYLIDHPDGLRIKRLRRTIAGGWALESLNPDKGTYPDEVISAADAELLKIRGEFVYRQGG